MITNKCLYFEDLSFLFVILEQINKIIATITIPIKNPIRNSLPICLNGKFLNDLKKLLIKQNPIIDKSISIFFIFHLD